MSATAHSYFHLCSRCLHDASRAGKLIPLTPVPPPEQLHECRSLCLVLHVQVVESELCQSCLSTLLRQETDGIVPLFSSKLTCSAQPPESLH